MSAVLPDRWPLEPPDEDRAALADVIAGVRGAAFRLGLLDVHLAGPEAHAPGWLGRDAAAAATQITAVARLGRDVHGALTEALGVLDRHGELLDHVAARIAVLRAQQEEDYAAAARRLGGLISSPALPGSAVEPAPVLAIREDLAAGEAARRREHEALLAELHADAVAAAHALCAATTVVGGTGRRGEAPGVIAHLAAALPGWGNGELADRGAGLARAMLRNADLRDHESGAREAESYAGTPAFADALLAALGPAGLRQAFFALADQGLDGDSPWAIVLAMALGGARPTGSPADPVQEVFDAAYVDPSDPRTVDDLVAVGIAAVLAAGTALPSGGVPPMTVARWGLQILRRERELSASSAAAYRAIDRTGSGSARRADPVAEVLRILAAADDPPASALLLSDRRSWAALLARRPPTDTAGGRALREVVRQAVLEEGTAGARAARGGVEALGTGLADGDPDHWPADRATAAAIAYPLALGVARHVAVAADLLERGGAGRSLDAMADAGLRGLGLLSLDPSGCAKVGEALAGWAVARTAEAADGGSAAAEAVGSFVAIRQYGQRLAYALHGFEQRDDALVRQDLFDWTAGLLQFLPSVAGAVAGLVLPFAAHWLGADGTWQNGPDGGLVLRAGDAAAAAEVQLDPADASRSRLLGSRAAAAFTRMMRRLGVPVPPDPPVWRWEQAALDALPLPDKARQFGYELPDLHDVLRDVAHGKGLDLTVREGFWGVAVHPFDDGSSTFDHPR